MTLADLLGVSSAQIYKWRFLALNKLRQVLRDKNNSAKTEFSAQTGVY
jgi:DNA-directed RNA polymerase specialized sigma24 family protein